MLKTRIVWFWKSSSLVACSRMDFKTLSNYFHSCFTHPHVPMPMKVVVVVTKICRTSGYKKDWMQGNKEGETRGKITALLTAYCSTV